MRQIISTAFILLLIAGCGSLKLRKDSEYVLASHSKAGGIVKPVGGDTDACKGTTTGESDNLQMTYTYVDTGKEEAIVKCSVRVNLEPGDKITAELSD